jgi:hypothetical protein
LGRYGTAFAGYRRERLLDFNITFTNDQGFGINRFGLGGTSWLRGGYAYDFKKILSVGASIGELFGNIHSGEAIESAPSGTTTLPSTLQKVSFSAYMGEIGATLRLGKLSVSATAAGPVSDPTASRERQIIQHFPDSTVASYFDSPDLIKELPVSGGVGVACSPSTRLHLAADAYAYLWEKSDRNTEYRLSGGAEWFFTDKRSDNYFMNIPIRLGYYYHDLGYTEGVREQALTLGWTLATLGNFGYLDFALEGGKRYLGGFSDNTLSETYSRLSVQFVHKGRWGRLRKAAENEF